MKILMRSLIVVSLLLAVRAHANGVISGVVSVLSEAGKTVSDRSGIVVFVEGIDLESEAILSASSKRTTQRISHKGFTFNPRVLPIVKGTIVDFLNDDGAYHNAFSVSKAKPFDLGIYPQGTSKQVSFDRSGLVRIYCNIHPDMISNVLVLNNSYYAITGPGGRFSINGLPDGNFTLRLWGEFIDDAHREFTLLNNATIKQNLSVTQRKRFKKHSNKFGKRYREKY